MEPKHTTREGWLDAATELLRPWFSAAGYQLPEKVHVSVGFPSKRALSSNNRRIGECWPPAISRDGFPHVFISPVLDDAVRVLGVLVHEHIHAAIGTEHGHKAPFKEAMGKLGLVGKPTATEESDELIQRLNALVEQELGPYPHPNFDADMLRKEMDKKKQGTRLLKASCDLVEGDESDPYVVRVTRVHLDKHGAPYCPCHTRRMKVEGWTPAEEDAEDEAWD